ncbi:MAG: CAP domain-containing protein [Actinomycetia bacterium]|nr:CAP domain-containing protein [Actinomycetes bacterium]
MLTSQWARRGLVALVAVAAAPALSTALTYDDHDPAPASVGTTQARPQHSTGSAADSGSLEAAASAGSQLGSASTDGSLSAPAPASAASPAPASPPAPGSPAASPAGPEPSPAQAPAARAAAPRTAATTAGAPTPRAAAAPSASPFVRSAAGSRGPAAAPSTDPARRVLELTNAERAKAGLAPLTWSPCLAHVAQPFSQTLASSKKLFHNSMGTVLSACGGRTAAENVAMGHPTPDAVVAGWMASPGHRANILNPQLKALGVGTARDGSGVIYWVQNFNG